MHTQKQFEKLQLGDFFFSSPCRLVQMKSKARAHYGRCESILHHFIPVFHLSCLIYKSGSVECTEGLEKRQFLVDGLPLKKKKLEVDEAISGFERRTAQKLNRAVTKSEKILLIYYNFCPASPPRPLSQLFFVYRNLTAIKYAPSTPSGTIPPPRTSQRRGPGSEATC